MHILIIWQIKIKINELNLVFNRILREIVNIFTSMIKQVFIGDNMFFEVPLDNQILESKMQFLVKLQNSTIAVNDQVLNDCYKLIGTDCVKYI